MVLDNESRHDDCELILFQLSVARDAMEGSDTGAVHQLFATASTMDHWLANGIRSIDCSRMSVREVIDRSLFYRRSHHQFMMILIPYAAIVLGCLGWASRADVYMLMGMGAGFLVGLAIGIRKYMDFMAYYRDIASDAE